MISVIDTTKFIRENKLKGPVNTARLFLDKSMALHPNGLFSEEIFGIEGSPDRRQKFSWIDLGCDVIVPSIYDTLSKRIEQKLPKMLAGELTMKVGESGVLEVDDEGDITGFSSFKKQLNGIKFRKNDDGGDRDRIVNMIEHNIEKGLFLTNKVLIIPADLRPLTIGETPHDVMMDEINDIYVKMINLASQIKDMSGTMYDILSYKMQCLVKELFDFVKVKSGKKQGMIRKLMLGKRVDFSARGVISPNPNLVIGEVGIPVKMACGIFEPALLYGICNSKYASNIPMEFHSAVKEFLGKELDSDF